MTTHKIALIMFGRVPYLCIISSSFVGPGGGKGGGAGGGDGGGNGGGEGGGEGGGSDGGSNASDRVAMKRPSGSWGLNEICDRSNATATAADASYVICPGVTVLPYVVPSTSKMRTPAVTLPGRTYMTLMREGEMKRWAANAARTSSLNDSYILDPGCPTSSKATASVSSKASADVVGGTGGGGVGGDEGGRPGGSDGGGGGTAGADDGGGDAGGIVGAGEAGGTLGGGGGIKGTQRYTGNTRKVIVLRWRVHCCMTQLVEACTQTDGDGPTRDNAARCNERLQRTST